LTFALQAGELFDLNLDTEYVETIIAKAIDKYIELQSLKYNDPKVQIDKALENVVQRMFQRCFDSNQYRQAAGISLESLRLDVLESAITKADEPAKLLAYVLDATMECVVHIDFRNKVLALLVSLYRKLAVPDYISISQCLVHLNQPTAVAEMLNTLSKGTGV
jgi:26S proteasome regulatory subunit N2